MQSLKNTIKTILMPVRESVKDKRAKICLKRINTKKRYKDVPIKVGFMVYEPETWDKLAPVYNEMIEAGKKVVFDNVGTRMYGLGIPDDLNYFMEQDVCKNVFD